MSRVLVILLALGAGACASTGAVPRPFPVPGTSAPAPAPAGEAPPTATGDPAPVPPAAPSRPVAPTDGYSISSTALSLRGAPYRNGGTDPGGFDCSGFVQYVFGQHGVPLPRDVRRQYDRGRSVDARALEPGDLVFFTTVAPGASHVGIVVGGDQFVHAPSTNGVVRVEHLGAQYWASRFVGAKRVN
jgi:cell wall-associated NlpC family hydrolase